MRGRRQTVWTVMICLFAGCGGQLVASEELKQARAGRVAAVEIERLERRLEAAEASFDRLLNAFDGRSGWC